MAAGSAQSAKAKKMQLLKLKLDENLLRHQMLELENSE